MNFTDRLRIFVDLAVGSVGGIYEPIKELGDELKDMAEENEADTVRRRDQINSLRNNYENCQHLLDIAADDIKDLQAANNTFRAQVGSLIKDVERTERENKELQDTIDKLTKNIARSER